MDKEQFINSGLLEQFALGLTTPEENELVNSYLKRFPELQTEVNNLHRALQQYASQHNIPQPPSGTPLAQHKEKTVQQSRFYKSAFFLTSILLFGLLFWVYQTQQQHSEKVTQLEAEYAALEVYCQQSQEKHQDEQVLVAATRAERTKTILLNATAADNEEEDLFAIFYWNPQLKAAWLDPAHLPPLAQGKQYQVWADVAGEMISIGLVPTDANDLLPISYLASAESINITVEQLGGASQPNVSLLMFYGLF